MHTKWEPQSWKSKKARHIPIYKEPNVLSIPNVAPGPLRSVKHPGMPETIDFHQSKG